MTDLTYFERRRLQMEYAVPLIKDLQAVLGKDLVCDALEQVNARRLRDVSSDKTADFSKMAEGAKVFAAGDALHYDIIGTDSDHFDMDVHHCRYADMMEELGGREFGHLLICAADFTSARQLGMSLERSQTRMQGADYCDFRYRRADTDRGD